MTKQEESARVHKGEGQADPAGDVASAPTAPQFAAFISYSHADTMVATRLQRQLENYRLPHHLRTSRPTDRLGKVFRDTADLAAATSLTDAIREALRQSSALIVLCSPDAQRSRWVDAEIRLFRELQPQAPILAVVITGDPAAVMPAALTEGGREPLAADMRTHGDGKALAFLKIVAALAGVPLDALIQRDAQRRVRRVTFVTLLALIALLVMSTMTVFAIKARNDARRQRAEAEGLVEYMLTDLRTRLKGVGRIQVMTAVNDRAMELYQRQGDLSNLPADSLARRARLLMAMGEDDIAQNALDPAWNKFAEANRTTETLVEREPDNADYVFAHAQSNFWLGRVRFSQNRVDDVRRYWTRYHQLAQQLARIDHDRGRAMREVGFAEGNFCTLGLMERRDMPATIARCRASLAAMRRVKALHSTEQSATIDVINRLGWLSEALVRNDQIDEALAVQRESLATARTLHMADPDNADYLDLLASSHLTLAKIEQRAGQMAEARTSFGHARDLLAALVRRDPRNDRWRGLHTQAADGARALH